MIVVTTDVRIAIFFQFDVFGRIAFGGMLADVGGPPDNSSDEYITFLAPFWADNTGGNVYFR